MLLALERFEEAVASYDKALSVRPDNADCHAGRGLALHALRRFEGALASYDRALAIDPDNGDGWFSRGNALHELRRFPEAVASFERALAMRPDSPRPITAAAGRCRRSNASTTRSPISTLHLAMKPFFADCLYSYGNALRERQPAGGGGCRL